MRGQDGGRGPRSGLPRPRAPCPRVPLESGISWTVVTCRCPSGVGAGVPGWAAGRRPPASEAQLAVGVRGQPVSPSMEPLPGWSSGQAPPGPTSQPLAEPRERQGDQWPGIRPWGASGPHFLVSAPGVPETTADGRGAAPRGVLAEKA